MVRGIAQKNGVVGVVLYNKFLNWSWNPGSPKSLVPVEIIGDVIDDIAQMLGNTDHIAIGSDFDGGFGTEAIPQGMDSIADLSLIPEILAGRGYASADIQNIMYGNWLRVLRASLP
jgi:membrane dipeptidase